MWQAPKYPRQMYQPALRIWLKEPGPEGSEVFICHGCTTRDALVDKYLLAHRQLFPETPVRPDDYCFQFGWAVHGTSQMMDESFMLQADPEKHLAL